MTVKTQNFKNIQQNWAKYYSGGATFKDYYLKFTDLEDVFQSIISPEIEVLEIGCGQSQISYFLKGVTQYITCIDFCKVVIDQMTHLNDKVNYIQMDSRDLKFTDCTFGLVYIKALLEYFDDVKGACFSLIEAHRVLIENGVLILITQMPVQKTREIVELCKWQSVHHHTMNVNASCVNGVEKLQTVNIFIAIK